jgi:hypothetical protein
MMRAGSLGVAAAVVTLTLLAPAGSRAQSGATLVAIVTAEPAASLTRRVRAELEGLGVDVIVLKPPSEGSTSRAPLEQAARSVGAVAAVRLVSSSGGKVEVWVADRVTGKAVVRELDAPGSGASDAAVALGTVELLRASLMELHSTEPPHGDAPATDKVRSLALKSSSAPWVPRLGVTVGAAAELGIRGLGPSANAEVDVWARVAPRLGARVVGLVSLTAAHAMTAAGAVDLQAQWLGVMAAYSFVDPSSPWEPRVSAGVAVGRVTTTGTAVPPYRSSSDDSGFVAPLAGAGLAWSFTRGLRLRGDGLAAWALPSLEVRTPTSAVGRWAAPALVVSLGVEVLWGP